MFSEAVSARGTLVQENITMVNSEIFSILVEMEKCFQHLRGWEQFSNEEKLKYVFLFKMLHGQNPKLI